MSRFASHADWYTPDPGEVEKACCGVCNTEMTVERSSSRPSGPVAWSRTMRTVDFFYCPHRKEQWHLQLKQLIEMQKNTPLRFLSVQVEAEIIQILETKKPTRRDKTFYDGL